MNEDWKKEGLRMVAMMVVGGVGGGEGIGGKAG